MASYGRSGIYEANPKRLGSGVSLSRFIAAWSTMQGVTLRPKKMLQQPRAVNFALQVYFA
jgi:hypothetical protein